MSMKCESYPTRNLGLVDWFRKGQSYIYDIDDSGTVIVRGYGANTSWVPLPKPKNRRFSFLPQTIVFFRGDDYLGCFANQLRGEVRDAPNVIFDDGHRIANFYCGTNAASRQLHRMRVYAAADTINESKSLLDECNNFQQYRGGRAIINHLHGKVTLPVTTIMAGARYYRMGTDGHCSPTAFDDVGHLDNDFVSSAWFVPLGQSFFTFVAVPLSWNYVQDQISWACYNRWKGSLNETLMETLKDCEDNFEKDAKVAMKEALLGVFVFENKIGSVLAFPTNVLFHKTVTPSAVGPRDVLVFHPLVAP